MTLEQTLVEFFDKMDYKWLVGGSYIEPDEQDFERFLDHCVKHLYNEKPGARLTVGRLIVEKVDQTRYDVYVHAGTFS